jgi:hypothetical protein
LHTKIIVVALGLERDDSLNLRAHHPLVLIELPEDIITLLPFADQLLSVALDLNRGPDNTTPCK